MDTFKSTSVDPRNGQKKGNIPDVWPVKIQTLQKQVLALQKVVYKTEVSTLTI